MNPNLFFNEKEKNEISNAITEAEDLTSGEIRVRIERTCNNNLKDRIVEVFNELRMYETERKNGVLIYLSIDDRQFGIIGDKGFDDMVIAGFWDNICDETISHMGTDGVANALVWCIKTIGKELSRFFPVMPDDKDELDNSISFGE